MFIDPIANWNKMPFKPNNIVIHFQVWDLGAE
jgi:hypothetical protein